VYRRTAPAASLWAAMLAVACPAKGEVDPGVLEAPPPPSFSPSRSFIPVPEIDVAPHSGLTVGVIPVTLSIDDKDQIRRILAPDVIYSQYFGWGARGRIFDFPSSDSQWSIVGGGKERVEREFDAQYVNGLDRHERWTVTLRAIYDRTGTARFFGIGNETHRAGETSYIDNQGRVEATVGENVSPNFQLGYAARAGFVDVAPLSLRGLPTIGTLYPTVNGLGWTHVLEHRLFATFDSRDSPSVPHSGARLVAYGGVASESLASSVHFSYVGLDTRFYLPIGDRSTLAAHAAARYMPDATRAPFWALSSLGGDRSVAAERQPLRGFGDDRFIDRHEIAAGVEWRERIADFRALSTRIDVELTPFLDAGKVFARADDSPLRELHHSFGVGVRAVAAPFVVGYVDNGPDKLAVFSGIDYPF